MKKSIWAYILVFSVLGANAAIADEVEIKESNFATKINFLVDKVKEPFTKISFKNKKENVDKDYVLTGTSAEVSEEITPTVITKETIIIDASSVQEDVAVEKKAGKKSFWKFWQRDSKDNIKDVSEKTVEEMLPKNDAASDVVDELNYNDTIVEEKQKAVSDANLALPEFFEQEETKITDLVEGTVEKGESEIIDASTVEGRVEETVILSLDDCIKKALENNPQIRAAFSSSEIYKTKIGQAWANYFPTFNMTNGVTRNRYLSINFPVPETKYTFYNAVDASASQLLFDFGKTKSLADMSKITYESSVATLDETINTIVYDVKSAYYSLLHSLEKQNVYADSVQSYEMQLKQAEAFYLIGTKPKIDVTMAQYNLGNAQLGYVKATNEVSLAVAQLNNAMGLPEEDEYQILDKLSMTEYDYDFDILLNKAYASRPELVAYEKKAKASELMLRSSKRAFLPDIEAVGAYAVGGGSAFTDDYGWTVGAQLVYGNTNLMLLKKQVDEAKATHKKDLADLDVAKQNVYLQVKQAFVNLKNAHESIPITALSLKHAKEQYDLASGRYRAGVGDAIELKDSEITYRNARLDYLTALLQYNISVADMERVVGIQLTAKEELK